MGRDRGLREIGDLRGLADIDAMHADLLLAPDLGGKRVQAGFVAVGNGKVAAARGQFDRQCSPDTARSSSDGSGGFTNHGHVGSNLG